MKFPGQPWGRVPQARLSPSPIALSNPYVATFNLEDGGFAEGARLYLAADSIGPEAAARVTLNGRYAGGFISKPLHLEISDAARAGENTLAIEPFTPEGLRLVVVQ